MKLNEVGKYKHVLGTGRGKIKVVFGDADIKSGEFKGMPKPLLDFLNKHGGKVIKGLHEGIDTVFFGDGSDWAQSDHEGFLDYAMSDGFDAEDAYETFIHGDDDIDYFRYQYGCEGDQYDDDDLIQDWNDLAYEASLSDAIKYGFVSKSWYDAAVKLGVDKLSEAELKKIDDRYEAVAEIYG
jgi:hypothetical protein